VGSSGSAKALGEICFQNGLSDGGITLDGLKWLRERMAKAGSLERLELTGLKPERRPVIPGGAAIMYALFQELGIQRMEVAQGAMREGILWDLLGRVHDHDMRDVTVTQFMRRYHVDGRQARRVERLALRLCQSFGTAVGSDGRRYLSWAARLHEVGISIAHSGLHKHGAYILENADMPGFSRRDQTLMANLVRASRGGLNKTGLLANDPIWPLVLSLRLAILLHGTRNDVELPNLRLNCVAGQCTLQLPGDWLRANSLTQVALEYELAAWQSLSPSVRLAAVRVG
jgi:exopolyphosphatase/guanosine-5'-triphosphate,3'-diphosphate pyrophosphatase